MLMLVAALVPGPTSRRNIQRGAAGVARVRFCETPSELISVASTLWVSGFLLDAIGPPGTRTESLVTRLRHRFAHVPVLIYCDLSAQSVRRIPPLTRAGADALVLSCEVTEALGSALRSAARVRRADRVLESLRQLIPPVAYPVMTHCLTHPRSSLTAASAARALGVSRRTLTRRLSAACLPPAGELVGWCRLITAAHLLDGAEGRGLEAVALGAGFQSAAALRSMFRRYTGRSPVTTRQTGALDVVMSALRAALLLRRREAS